MPTKPLPLIFEPVETVNKRVTLYLENKYPLLNTQIKANDDSREETRWVWYSKEHIQTWLSEMEDLNADGMRIYFGEKEIEEGDEANTNAQKAKASGQLCLLMILTRPGSFDNSHINIIYENESDYVERKALYDNSRQFNFGGYCPPMSITEGDDYPNDSIS
ncbi:MAG TPA: hypothetical protein VK483_10685 [Chitinophagaceae bacterium]|nr:hypothetical protein [Chitinophagaceae bacterium]